MRPYTHSPGGNGVARTDLVTEQGHNPRKHAFVTQIIGTDTINAHNRVSDEQRAQRALTVLAALHAHYVSWQT